MAKAAERKTGKRRGRKKPEPASRGLTPRQVAGQPPAAVRELQELVEGDGGAVLGAYRDPLGGRWQLLVALPLERVAPTPFQRDLSAAHVKRLSGRLDELDRFLDPVILVRQEDGQGYWTPNGSHRLAAMRELGARSVVGLLVPETDMAYRILALNTEKAHNLKERCLEVIRMARDLAGLDPGPEREYGEIFEEPAFLTLGACYEQRRRFSGSVYHPVVKRAERFLGARLPKALETREARAGRLLELEDRVVDVVEALKERGFESPYLKNFVVARINPLRFRRGGGKADFDQTLDRMIASARRFDASKVRQDHLARSGGPPGE